MKVENFSGIFNCYKIFNLTHYAIGVNTKNTLAHGRNFCFAKVAIKGVNLAVHVTFSNII